MITEVHFTESVMHKNEKCSLQKFKLLRHN